MRKNVRRRWSINYFMDSALPGHSRDWLPREKIFQRPRWVHQQLCNFAVPATKTRSVTTPLLSMAKLASFPDLENVASHDRVRGHRTGLQKSAAIRPFATKKSRLASEKILLVDSLATESCRFADRLATKLFFQSGQHQCGPNVVAQGAWQSLSAKDARELAVRPRRLCLAVNLRTCRSTMYF